MYLKHPVTTDVGEMVTKKHLNPTTGEVMENQVPKMITLPIGKLEDKHYKRMSQIDIDRLEKAGILFKTEKAAYTIPEPEGMKLVDSKKDDETKDKD